MITNWIVLNSMQKGLLKNVQDGTSRCCGGQELTKLAMVEKKTSPGARIADGQRTLNIEF